MKRVSIKWADTAKLQLEALPKKVRKGLIAKADELLDCDNPHKAHKPLVGPLAQYYRFTYSRYRAVYSVEEDKLASGDVLVHIEIHIIAVGLRKEHDKNDIYKLAEKMVKFGLINFSDKDEELEEDDLD